MAVKFSCVLHPTISDCTPYQLFSVSTLTSAFTGKLLALKPKNPPGWPFLLWRPFPFLGLAVGLFPGMDYSLTQWEVEEPYASCP